MKTKNYLIIITCLLTACFMLSAFESRILSAQSWQSGKDVIKGYKGWEGNPDSLTVYIDPNFDSAQTAQIRQAMQRWNNAGCSPKFKETSSKPAKVTINKGDPGKNNEGVWKPSLNPTSKKRDSGEIIVKTSPSTSGLSFEELVTHELGHALGLDDTNESKNPSDVMRGKGTNSTGDLSKHDSTQMKAAMAVSAKVGLPKKGAENAKAIKKGETTAVFFDLSEFVITPPFIIEIDTFGDDLIYIEGSNLNGSILEVLLFVDPLHGSGTFYLNVFIHEEGFPPLTHDFIGYHYVCDDPLEPVFFDCSFTIEQDGSCVIINWVHTYPLSVPLRTIFYVNDDPYLFDKDAQVFEFELEPGEYELTLNVDDFQVNSASFTMDYIPNYATSILPGTDQYIIPHAIFGFGPGFEFPPLPEGFFGPGSDPFEGAIEFEGLFSGGGQLPETDFSVSRLFEIEFTDPLPSSGSTDVDITIMSGKSKEPIPVERPPLPPDSFFDVFFDVKLEKSGSDGLANITQQDLQGGVFDMDLSVQLVFTFVNTIDPTEVYVYDPSSHGIAPIDFNSYPDYPWTLSPKEGEFDPLGYDLLHLNTATTQSYLTLIPLLQRMDHAFLRMAANGTPDEYHGTGYNEGEWYYYPNTDWWNVWFYDHPVTPERRKAINGIIVIEPFLLGIQAEVEIVLNWSTPQWPGYPNMPRPPLPEDFIGDPGLENMMIVRSEPLFYYQGLLNEPMPIQVDYEIPFYNPEWLSIDVRGFNFILVADLQHTCWDEWENGGLYEFGDAPEGDPAYIGGAIGQFPTCMNVGPAGFISHNCPNPLFFGGKLDCEGEGNAGLCPMFTPNNYNMDECGTFPYPIPPTPSLDEGLIFPIPLNIVGPVGSEQYVSCVSGNNMALGSACTFAVWGTHIDIWIDASQSAGGYVNVLFDWDQSGFWAGGSSCNFYAPNDWVPEHVLVNHVVPAGFIGLLSALNPNSFQIGPNSGPVWARFSLTDQPVPWQPGGPGWDGEGSFSTGETEDYLINITDPMLDFGDAPAPYPTLLVNNGAHHDHVGPNIMLGSLKDFEPDGFPDNLALGDDNNNLPDEDGVVLNNPVNVNKPVSITVTSNTQGALLHAWADFNGNGSWADPGEQIFANQVLNAGANMLTFNVPSNAMPGPLYTRFRVNNQQNTTYTGYSSNGEVEDYMWEMEPEMDYGDAPDGPYPTLLASDGARHAINSQLFLGSLVDSELDGHPSLLADGDDNDNLDDEDGVVFTTALIQGQVATVQVTVPIQCRLNAWIDFNQINSWADPGEHIFANQLLTAGVNILNFNVPASAVAGNTYARFRVNSSGGITYYGYGYEGEVEDYIIGIQEPVIEEYDFGDAPDGPYPTLLANDGARHLINQSVYLGVLIDSENDGQPTPLADGDNLTNLDDEDGVVFIWPVAAGNPCKLKVTASVDDAYLNAWFDFNQNGSWADPEDHILIDVPLNIGDNYLNFIAPPAPGTVPGLTFARFRFSHDQNLSFTGPATDGEVEDYVIDVDQYGDNKWRQLPNEEWSGLHCHDYWSGPDYFWITGADDWLCAGGMVTDIHWWGNYEHDEFGNEIRGVGIDHFHLSIHNNDLVNCVPLDPPLWSVNVPFSQANETWTGLVNNEGCKIYLYEYYLPEPFPQIEGNRYWLDIAAVSVEGTPAPHALWRWQEADRGSNPILCRSTSKLNNGPWNIDGGSYGHDMAFVITSEFYPPEEMDYGDAPEGALAYPASSVIGQFPTCMNVGPPASFIRHNLSGPFFGPAADPEQDGNAGACPVFNPGMYDMDECFADGDAGLLVPGSFTIAGTPGAETVLPCAGAPPVPLGNVCTPATWGANIDIHVHNFMPGVMTAYVNVLIDWDQNGMWGGASSCSDGLYAPEHVLTNFPVPFGHVGPLSALMPPAFLIGPNSGYVWARFTITDTPVIIPPDGWDGMGEFESGETEDYLLLVHPQEDLNLQNITVPGGTTICYEAANTITTGGSGTNFIVQNNAVVYLVAGYSVKMLPGTHFQNGSQVHAYIDLSGEFCTNPKAIELDEEPLPEILPFEFDDKESFFRVYPNPNIGQFTLELKEVNEHAAISVEIFSLVGETVMKLELPEIKQYLFDLSARQPGVYLIRVTKGDVVGVEKVIKH
jgi:hypothetical protein